jgi:ankyrin repeat protein
VQAARIAGQSDIIAAAKSGAVADVRDHLIADASSAHARDFNKRSPLHWSAYHSQLELSQLLLGYRPHPCSCSTISQLIFCSVSDFTPLHRSALNEHIEVSQLLLSANADVNARTHMYAPYHPPPPTPRTRFRNTALSLCLPKVPGRFHPTALLRTARPSASDATACCLPTPTSTP